MRRIMAIDFCARQGAQYCHSPFDHLAHADRAAAEFDSKWEQTFALGDGFPVASKNTRTFNYAELAQFGLLQFYQNGPFQGLSEGLLAKLRQGYRKGKPAVRDPVFTVAMHIRRGDVTPDDWPELWVGIDGHARTAQLITDRLRSAGIPFALQIFSQGKPDEFAQLGVPEAQFHLDEDPFWSFDQLAIADLLVSTDSGFSHFAALLNEGIVISPDFGVPLAGWIRRERDGSFDLEQLARSLNSRLSFNLCSEGEY